MKTIGILIIAFLVNATIAMSQKSLSSAKSNLSGSSSSSRSSRTSSSSSDADYSNSDSEGALSQVIGEAILHGMAFITYGTLIGDVEPRSFNAYPYTDGDEGEYRKNFDQPKGKQSLVRLSNTVILNSYLVGNDVKLNYRFVPFLGAEVNHLHFFERSSEKTDLGITSLMLNYYRIRENRVSGYWGLGATFVGSGVNTVGFTYDLGLDVYVANPVSLGFSWKQAFINSSPVNEFCALARYHLNKIAFQGGFVHYKIGSVNYPSGVLGVEIRL